MSDKQKTNSQLLDKLIQSILPIQKEDPKFGRLSHYCLRQLQSNSGAYQDLDNVRIKNQMQNIVEKTNPKKLDRTFQLIQMFELKRVVNNKPHILKILLKLSNP